MLAELYWLSWTDTLETVYIIEALLLAHPRGILLSQARDEQEGPATVHIDCSIAVCFSHTKHPVKERLLEENNEWTKHKLLILYQ